MFHSAGIYGRFDASEFFENGPDAKASINEGERSEQLANNLRIIWRKSQKGYR